MRNRSSRFIPFSDMYITDYSVNYTTYNYDYKYTLDAEGQITSAIQYVTAGSRTNMYVVSAHNEVALEDNMKSMVAKANIEMLDFDVLTQTSVPEDCDILFINGPTVDISAEELVMYKEYLDKIGRAHV